MNRERETAELGGGEEATFAGLTLPFATVHVCALTDQCALVEQLESEFVQEYDEDGEPTQKVGTWLQSDDVLDTWFSSALWPHSTLGWPEQTPELEYYYPTSTLVTSRDIITLWVARMVLTGLYNVGDVPFREVFIHPKILDGFGEGMSKSKGNGVDPLDVIEKFGADALRFGLAYMTTETQDVRLPVEFECPNCGALIEQTKKNRVMPRIECSKCHQPFSTQWASKPADLELPRGAVVGERFELGRNFCNKLWNASRFALMNLEDYTPGTVSDDELALEDRWILSRLATVTASVTDALGGYRYADAARALYDFAWEEFCSFYLEMVKTRLQDAAGRPAAQRVFAYTLDNLLRLLHPMIPFITEEVWQLLGQAAGQRGLDELQGAAESVMIADWPAVDAARQNPEIEARFARFQQVLKGLREIRSRQNISPKTPIRFSAHGFESEMSLLRSMVPYFESMGGAQWTEPEAQLPVRHESFMVPGIEVIVDLSGIGDLGEEIIRNKKEIAKLEGLIESKEKQLSNEHFTKRAPAEVVQKEQDALARLKSELLAREDQDTKLEQLKSG
jgi:valyl-tRNA synthetase